MFGLFVTAPLVAEFLLGDFSIKMLSILIVIAPMYGGGALLIRELVRRTGRGWPTILLLAMAYAIVEEAFTTQSLFNANYMNLNLGLLKPAFIPAFGIGGWWTLWMLMVHAIWSISTPIALIEACVPQRARTPWTGHIGLAALSIVFLFGAVIGTLINYKMNHFMASRAQFGWAAVAVVLLIVAAFSIPARRQGTKEGEAPSAWVVGGVSLMLASAAMLVPPNWGWGAVATLLALVVSMLLITAWWMRKGSLTIRHQLAMGAGAALTYGWHAFLMKPVVGTADTTYRVGNGILLAGVIILVAFAAIRSNPEPCTSLA
ncbi:MAG: hypothetical protein ACRD3S_10565 [Terracidiphilus sp.]